MRPVAAHLPGDRLHLQHGPIDLILGAEGPGDARQAAFAAAAGRFDTVLDELVQELDLLRAPLDRDAPFPGGVIARHMDHATRPFAHVFVTRMAAVAGAVADTVLSAMRRAAPLRRAYVNNGGDIALHLSRGQRFRTAIRLADGSDIGQIDIDAASPVRGVATSGQMGRSFSMGIADSVTVLATSAAQADAAATLLANAVDLPGHPGIRRAPAEQHDPDSDLGARAVVIGCGILSRSEISEALENGLLRAECMLKRRLLLGAALHFRGQTRIVGDPTNFPKRSLAHA